MNTKPKLAAIVACADNRVIGNNNALPWHLPEDLKHFKNTTMGKPLIMGRLTFDSLGKPLPGRPHIVVTRQPHWSYSGVQTANSLEQAIDLGVQKADELNVDEVMIVGGAKIYHQALPLADVLYVTEVHTKVDGDALFPEIDPAYWQEIERDGPHSCENNGLRYSFVIFRKRADL